MKTKFIFLFSFIFTCICSASYAQTVGPYTGRQEVSIGFAHEPSATSTTQVIITVSIKETVLESVGIAVITEGTTVSEGEVEPVSTGVDQTIWTTTLLIAPGKTFRVLCEVTECVNASVHVEYSPVEIGSSTAGEVGPEGKEGKESKFFHWRGEWKSGVSYSMGDVVEKSGSSYVCIKDMSTSEDTSPVEAEHWQLMVSVGGTGERGERGESSGTGKVDSFGTGAESDLSELKETGEIMGWCIVGTMLALSIIYFTYKLVVTKPS